MSKAYYPEVNPNPDFPAIEAEVLSYWQKEGMFQKSVDHRPATLPPLPLGEGRGEGLSALRGPHPNPLPEGEGITNNEFIFYDGPPFANGLPHYGHLLTGFVKDLFARYETMKGKRVERRFGWDCHGLPAEMGSEKELGISGRQAIINYGIGKFNDHCRASVMKYAHEWETYVTRQARWVDFKNDYKTMDTNFMESVLWAFSQLYNKGLIYEAYRVMPYSWAAETPLSNFETKLDNSYREREDKAITVAFKLNTPPHDAPKAQNYYVLAWTTTPWTLPSNLALAISKNVDYRAYTINGNCYFATLAGLEKGFPNIKAYLALKTDEERFAANPEGELSDYLYNLLGLSYTPLFPYFESHKHAFKILDGSSFVTDSDGTGIVHMAPGFGEEDQKCCEANGIEVVVPVDGQGKYTSEIFDIPLKPSPAGRGLGEGLSTDTNPLSNRPHPDLLPEGEGVFRLKGLNVIAETNGQRADEPYKPEQVKKYGLANLRIIQWLKEHGKLIKQEEIKHNYPHCWRTDQPLIYRAMPSWYVEVTKFRDRAVELNQEINWIPSHIRDGQMGHMLATAPDWSISRNRFWGTPIPVWRRQDSGSGIQDSGTKVFGSIAELEAFFDVDACFNDGLNPESRIPNPKITDLHRPFIDKLTIAKDGSRWKRVEDVFDCWFESGSMPFAQVHYPFENKDWFESHFPADFITEYVGQTRGWFNTLIMLSTALFDKPPFKNCICHGVVLDAETGLKYSKRLKNYKDPLEVINVFGADALRWLMIASPVMRGLDLMVDPEGKFIRDVVRLAIKPIWNAYNFFVLYANADGVKAKLATDSTDVMDRYILAKCKQAVGTIEASLDAYDTPGACDAVMQFFEALNNWYIRRNKERFWKTERDADKQAAYDTLYTVLVTLCKAGAPLLPLTCEEIYLGLTGKKPSPAGRGLGEGVSPNAKSKTDEERIDKARGLRHNSTDAEICLWNRLRDRQIAGAKFKRQQPIGDYIVDLFCHDAKLIVELDGGQHAEQQKEYDEKRDAFLEAQGYKVMRFWNHDVLKDTDGVLQVIYDYISMANAAAPSPNPLPEGEGLSVHLADFPDVSAFPDDAMSVSLMDSVRDICNAALAIRNKVSIRVRQPLQKITAVGNKMNYICENNDFRKIITDEINVKEIISDPSGLKEVADFKVSINSPLLGKILKSKGKEALMKQIIPASKKGEWEKIDDTSIKICGEIIHLGAYMLQLEPKPEYKDHAQPLSTNDALVILDTTITPELEAEGIARDLVRMIQQARKDAALNVSDRIELHLEAPEAILNAVNLHRKYIMEQTLTVAFADRKPDHANVFGTTNAIDDQSVTISLTKAA